MESAWNLMVQKAKQRGFVKPDFNSKVPEKKGRWARKEPRECPWYKKMKDTSLSVDAFNYGVIPNITHYVIVIR